MKTGISWVLAVFLIFFLAGCGGMSEGEYDQIRAERDALRLELQEMESREPDTVQAVLRGTFTATVRALLPDYVSDDTTPATAVVTLFQSGPFLIPTGDFTDQLEIGETYVFEIREKTVEIAREEYEVNFPVPEVVFPKYNLRLSGFRESVESDWGLDSVHLVYEKYD